MANYDLKVDGLAGEQTKSAIKDAFGFDCEMLSDFQIVERVGKQDLSKLISKPPYEVRYQLSLKKNDQELKLKENLTEEDLNSSLEKIQEENKMECGIDEVCTSIHEKSASVSFECKDAFGNKITLTISTEGKISIALKSKSGRSMTLGANKDGKISFSEGNKHEFN